MDLSKLMRDKAPSGSVAALLKEDDVHAVASEYGDGMLRCFGINVVTDRTAMTARDLRCARSFAKDYGVDNAVLIVSRLFSMPYGGKYKGVPIGAGIFYKRYRWLANRLFAEGASPNDGGSDGGLISRELI